MSNVVIRKAEKRDCPSIKELLDEFLAYNESNRIYNGINNEIGTYLTIKDLEINGFGEANLFKTIVAEIDTSKGKRLVGYASYYYLYSSFIGRSSCMEDLFVTEKFRFSGIGGKLLKALVKEVKDVGCSRVDFQVAKWNTPAIKCYKKYGAINLTEEEDMSSYRIEYNEMAKMVENFDINSPTLVKSTSESKNIGNVKVRRGKIADCVGIMENIRSLANYENNPERVKINANVLKKDGFGDQSFYNIFVAEEETPQGYNIIGYAFYVFTYAIVGRCSFMEELFVNEERRYIGLEAALWKAVIQDTLQKGGQETNFTVLNRNKAGIKFYLNYGAYSVTDKGQWEMYRYDMNAMKKLIS